MTSQNTHSVHTLSNL